VRKATILAGMLCLAAMCSYPQSSTSGGGGTSCRGFHRSRRGHSITLTWTASTSSGVTGYNIYRSEGKHTRYTKLNAEVVSGTSYVDRCVRAGHTYHYVAKAVGQRNIESANSQEASARVPTP
jgi:fibronectin type 3 domain-containing protein